MLRIHFEGIGFGKLFFRPAWNKSAFPQFCTVCLLFKPFWCDNGSARRTHLRVRHTPRCQSTASVNDIRCATGFGKTNSMLALSESLRCIIPASVFCVEGQLEFETLPDKSEAQTCPARLVPENCLHLVAVLTAASSKRR